MTFYMSEFHVNFHTQVAGFAFFQMVKQFLTIGFWGTKFVHTTQQPSQQLT